MSEEQDRIRLNIKRKGLLRAPRLLYVSPHQGSLQSRRALLQLAEGRATVPGAALHTHYETLVPNGWSAEPLRHSITPFSSPRTAGTALEKDFNLISNIQTLHFHLSFTSLS